MIEENTIKAAYDLFTLINAAESDAAIVALLAREFQSAVNTYKAATEAAGHRGYAAGFEAGKEQGIEDLIREPFLNSSPEGFSFAQANGPVGEAYRNGEGHDFSQELKQQVRDPADIRVIISDDDLRFYDDVDHSEATLDEVEAHNHTASRFPGPGYSHRSYQGYR